mgnify:CR=1 FL=1
MERSPANSKTGYNIQLGGDIPLRLDSGMDLGWNHNFIMDSYVDS